MRIYVVGFFSGHNTLSQTTSTHMQIVQKYKYPWMLESFHYVNQNLLNSIRRKESTIFLDSGAFSMFTQGIKVDLKDYARFILRNQDIVHVASNLDVIGEGHEQESYDRQKELEEYLGEAKHLVKPVHHVRDNDEWLQRYIDEGYDYIFLGGMVPESNKTLFSWLDKIWYKYLTNPDGTAKVKIHGFGLTNEHFMFRYPWYSVDSATWVMASRYGMVIIERPQHDGSIKWYKVAFSTRSPTRYDVDGLHFWSLKEDEKQIIIQELEKLEADRIEAGYLDDPQLAAMFEQEFGCKMGFNAEALSKSYGLRDIANMEYYRRAMERQKTGKFLVQQETLF